MTIDHGETPHIRVLCVLAFQVPLAATFRGVSCVTANTASKAILRVAVDELMRENGVGGATQSCGLDAIAGVPGEDAQDQVLDASAHVGSQLYYWPAYEMVKEGFSDPYLEDGRHPKPEVVGQILELFGKYYLPREPASKSQPISEPDAK
jgi:hypothetical protein